MFIRVVQRCNTTILCNQQIFQLLVEINKEENLPILLVEQNAHMALGISHRTYVLSTGEIIMEGRSADMRNDPKVQDAYL